VVGRPVDASKIYANDGTLIGPHEIAQIGRNCLMAIHPPLPPTEGPATMRVVDHAPPLYMVDANGDRVGLRRVEIDITYEIRWTLRPLEFREYFDRAAGKQLYTVGVANVDLPGVEGDVVLYEEGGEGNLVFVPGSRPIPEDVALSVEVQFREEGSRTWGPSG
jgi:hypothetical protein